MSLARKRVLVTGGAGFLGSHLCDALVSRGDDVLWLDNYFTGRKDNIAHLLGNPRFETLRHDVTFPLFVEVDEIYNLACPASPIHYQFDPVQTAKISIIGAINMLGLAKRTQARVLQASTSEVYGDPAVHPQTEACRGNVNPLGPRACYDTLYGDGSQTRSFCYVDDLVAGLIRLMDTPDDVTGPVNLGNPAELPMRALAERVIALTGSASPITTLPLPEDDPLQRCPDIGLARPLLEWEPVMRLDSGLIRTIAYFDHLLRERGSLPTPRVTPRYIDQGL